MMEKAYFVQYFFVGLSKLVDTVYAFFLYFVFQYFVKLVGRVVMRLNNWYLRQIRIRVLSNIYVFENT